MIKGNTSIIWDLINSDDIYEISIDLAGRIYYRKIGNVREGYYD